MANTENQSDFIPCPHCENTKVYRTSPICPKCRKRMPHKSSAKPIVLVIVVAVFGMISVIGILAAIAIPAYHEYAQRAQEASAYQLEQQVPD